MRINPPLRALPSVHRAIWWHCQALLTSPINYSSGDHVLHLQTRFGFARTRLADSLKSSSPLAKYAMRLKKGEEVKEEDEEDEEKRETSNIF